jgi:hypothetical protein
VRDVIGSEAVIQTSDQTKWQMALVDPNEFKYPTPPTEDVACTHWRVRNGCMRTQRLRIPCIPFERNRRHNPENLITWRTPATFDASINVFCVSTMSMSGAEIMRTRSTPSRGVSLFGLVGSLIALYSGASDPILARLLDILS